MNPEENQEAAVPIGNQPAAEGPKASPPDVAPTSQNPQIIAPNIIQPDSSVASNGSSSIGRPQVVNALLPNSNTMPAVPIDTFQSGQYPLQTNQSGTGQPVSSTVVPPKKKRSKKIIIFITIILVLLAALAAGVFIYSKDKNQLGIEPKPVSFSTSISSPIGLIPEVAESKSGKFKLKFPENYDKIPEIEGTYYIDDTGDVWFDVIPNIEKVNTLMDYLVTKYGDEIEGRYKIAYDQGDMKAAKFASIDFADLITGKQLLSSYPSVFDGLAYNAEQALNGREFEEDAYGFRLTQECRSSIDALRTVFSNSKLNTKNLVFMASKIEDSYTYELSQEILDDKNRNIETFFANCFNNDQGSNDDTYKDLLENYTRAGERHLFSYSKTDEGYSMEIFAGSKDSSFTIQLSPAQEGLAERPEGIKRGIFERPMRFGIAYNACRVVPVSISSFTHSYRFKAEDTRYAPPSDFDDRYYCTVADANRAFNYSASAIRYKIERVAEVHIPADSLEHEYLVLFHDVAYFIERHYVEKGFYPTLQELLVMKNMPEGMIGALEEMTRNKLFEYKVSPTGCDTECDDYSFKHYLHKNIILNKEPFNKMITEKVQILEQEDIM